MEQYGSSKSCTSQCQGCVAKFTSCRWVLAYMLFFLRMCQTALRQSIGMALVCMTECPANFQPRCNESESQNDGLEVILSANNDTNSPNRSTIQAVTFGDANQYSRGNTSIPCFSGTKEFSWDASFEGLLLSSYYYGYLLTPLLSSYLERLVGAKRLVAISISLGAIVNLMSPELTRMDKHLLVALRVVAGTTNGMIDPAIQSLWASWAPRSELAHLTAVEYAGVSMGGIFTFLISGLLCQTPWDNGWPLVFYFYGTTSLLWVVFWMSIVYNEPSDHPRIQPAELKLIKAETYGHSEKKQLHPPWIKILSSPPVWSILIASASFMWVYSWILCYLPSYMRDILRFEIGQNALFSSFPFVGKFFIGIACGYLADRLLGTNLSLTAIRKIFQMVGSIGCAIATVIIGFLGYSSRYEAVALLIIAVSLQNITTVAYRVNALDIAPRYSGFILGISSTFAVAVSLTAPLVTAAVIPDKTQTQWQIMFCVVAALSVIGGVVFLVFGDAKLQPWATSEGNGNENGTDVEKVFIAVEDQKGDHDMQLKLPPNDESGKEFHVQTSSGLSPSNLHSSARDIHKDFHSNPAISLLSPGTPSLSHRGSPLQLQRRGKKDFAQTVQDMDAISQWSSCVSLTG